MRVLILGSIILLALCANANADFVITLTQAASGPIRLGENAVFNVDIRSTVSLSNFGGVDFAIDAADPLGDTTLTAGGHFISGTNSYAATMVDAFQIPFPTSFQFFNGNSNGVDLALGTSDTRLASLTLSTVGATPGHYRLGLASISAGNTNFNEIANSNLSSTGLDYTIAVPEPSSFIIVAAGWLTLGIHRRRRLAAPRR